MRGSILVTFDENLDARGGQSYQLNVGVPIVDLHFTDANKLYSYFVFTGDTVTFIVNRSSYLYKSEVLIKRLDFTNDDEEGDKGIKETIILPTVSYTNTTTTYTFTATTISSAYNFHYVIECTTSFCYDNSSGFTGTSAEITDIDILSNGKVMVSGEYSAYRGTSANRVVQLNQDGTINTGFTYGTGFSPDTTNELVELSNGKLIFVGQFTNYNGTSCNRIIGLNADGTVNTGFTTGTGFSGDPVSIERQSDDKVIITGFFLVYNGQSVNRIVRLNTNGTRDTSFVTGIGFNGDTFSAAVQSDGKIIIIGNFSSYNGNSAPRICRLNSNGSFDNTFNPGTGFNDVPYEVKIQPDGKIIVAGLFTSYNGNSSNYIVRLNTDGSIDNTFAIGTGFNSTVFALELIGDGTILVGGQFTSYNGNTTRPRFIGLNSNGSINTNIININVNSTVQAIAVASDGDIYVGGLFTTCQGLTVQRFVKLGRNGLLYSCLDTTPTPTPTPTMTPTPTPTPTATPIPTLTPTPTPVITGYTGATLYSFFTIVDSDVSPATETTSGYTTFNTGTTWNYDISMPTNNMSLSTVSMDYTGRFRLNRYRSYNNSVNNDKIFYSYNFGQSQIEVTGLTGRIYNAVLAKNFPNYMYVYARTGATANNYVLYKSSNEGQTWSSKPAPLATQVRCAGNGQFLIAFLPSISPSYNFHISYDYGENWSVLGNGYISDVCFSDSGQYIYYVTNKYPLYANFGQVFKSSDYGVTFTDTGLLIPTYNNYTNITTNQTGQYVYVSGQDNNANTYRSTDYGNTFTIADSSKSTEIVTTKSGKDVYAVQNTNIKYSNNYGASWTLLNIPNFNLTLGRTIYGINIDCNGQDL